MTDNMKKYLVLLSEDRKAKRNGTDCEDVFFEKLQKELIEDAAKRGITLTKADFIETREWQEEELTISAKKKDMLDTHCTCFASGVGTAG